MFDPRRRPATTVRMMASAPRTLPASRIRRFPQERLSDAELIHAIRRGDAEAAGVVWDRYAPLLRTVLRSSLGVHADAEDILQDVFIAFLTGVQRLRAADSLRPYLLGIAIRRVADEWRRKHVRRWMTLLPSDDAIDAYAGASDMESARVLSALHRVLERLPSRRRMAFILRHVHGFEVAAAAQLMRVSESTIKRELRRAQAQIASSARKREPWLWDYLQRVEANRAQS